VFVSSTFSDLVDERDALQRQVFPRLQQFCETRGCGFQAIDLRWGISTEASLDQRTMEICLEELTRCRTVSPRPNFIALLGDRYGWEPLPSCMPSDAFDRFRDWSCEHAPGAVATLDDWYRLDSNSVPPARVLRARVTGSPEADPAHWTATVEAPLRDLFRRAIPDVLPADDLRSRLLNSATHQEIDARLPSGGTPTPEVFAFVRTIENFSDAVADPAFQPFFDRRPDGTADREAHRRIADLREDLRRRLQPSSLFEYRTRWVNGALDRGTVGVLPDSLDACLDLIEDGATPRTLCEAAWIHLGRSVDRQTRRASARDPLAEENDRHGRFAVDRAAFFVGRAPQLEALHRYVHGPDHEPLVVHGESGSGKSALLARAAALIDRSGFAVLQRFCGTSARCSSPAGLVLDLCEQLGRHGRFTFSPPDHHTVRDLASSFATCLSRVDIARPIVIVIDALDQLEGDPDTGWIPTDLPPGVKLIVSTLPAPLPHLPSLRARLPRGRFLEVPLLTPAEGDEAIDTFLRQHGRTLAPAQREELHKRFSGNRSPLYLRLALLEVTRWRSFDGVPVYDGAPGLSPTTAGLIGNHLWRLSQPDQHGPVLVRRALAYLRAARHGLSEGELTLALGRDPLVRDHFARTAHHETVVDALPFVLWARLHAAFQPYLTTRDADDTPVIAFYHRQIGELVDQTFLEDDREEIHGRLALLFAVPDGAPPSRRTLSELPYQLTMARRWAELEELLTDLKFLEHKLRSGASEDLVADFERIGAGRHESESPLVTRSVWSGRAALGCPYCLGCFELPDDLQGERLKCAHCRSPLRVTPFAVRRPWELRNPSRHVQLDSRQMIRADVSPAVADFGDLLSRDRIHLDRAPGSLFQRCVNQPSGRATRAVALGQAPSHDRPWLQLLNHEKEASTCVAVFPASGRFCRVTPDGRQIVLSAGQGARALFLRSGEPVAPGSQPSFLTYEASESAALSPDGSRVLSAHEDQRFVEYVEDLDAQIHEYDGHLVCWDADSGEMVNDVRMKDAEFEACAWFPDGVHVALVLTPDVRTHIEDDGFLGATKTRGQRRIAVLRWDRDAPLRSWAWDDDADKAWSCCVSPDGGMIATIRQAWSMGKRRIGEVAVWDAGTGDPLWTAPGEGPVSFSPDGAALLVGAVVHNARGGEMLCRGPAGGIAWSAWSPGGDAVATARGKQLVVWNPRTGDQQVVLEGHTEGVLGCDFTPDGWQLVSVARDDTVRVWDLRSVDDTPTEAGWRSSECVVSRQGLHAAWTEAGRLRLGHLSDGVPPLPPGPEIEGRIVGLDVSRDGSRAIVRTRPPKTTLLDTVRDRTVTWLLDTATGQPLQELPGEALFTDDGRTVIAHDGGSGVSVLSAASGAVKRRLEGYAGRDGLTASETLAPTGRCLFLAGDSFRIRDTSGRPDLLTLVGQSSAGLPLADGRFHLRRSGRSLRVLDTHTGLDHRAISAPEERGHGLAVSPDGRTVVSTPLAEGHAHLLDLVDGTVLMGIWGPTGTVEFSSDGRFVLAEKQHPNNHPERVGGTASESFGVWEVATGACVASGPLCRWRAFTPDSRRVVTLSEEGTLAIHDIAGDRRIVRFDLEAHGSGFTQHRAGRRIVAGDQGGRQIILRPRNVGAGAPWVTPARLFDHAAGAWEGGSSVRCPWCEGRYEVPGAVTSRIATPRADASRDEAIRSRPDPDDPRLSDRCPRCQNPLRYTPFAVDNSSWDSAPGPDAGTLAEANRNAGHATWAGLGLLLTVAPPNTAQRGVCRLHHTQQTLKVGEPGTGADLILEGLAGAQVIFEFDVDHLTARSGTDSPLCWHLRSPSSTGMTVEPGDQLRLGDHVLTLQAWAPLAPEGERPPEVARYRMLRTRTAPRKKRRGKRKRKRPPPDLSGTDWDPPFDPDDGGSG